MNWNTLSDKLNRDFWTYSFFVRGSMAMTYKRCTFEYYPISCLKCFCNSLPSLFKSCVNPIIAKIIRRIKNAKLAPWRLKMLWETSYPNKNLTWSLFSKPNHLKWLHLLQCLLLNKEFVFNHNVRLRPHKSKLIP